MYERNYDVFTNTLEEVLNSRLEAMNRMRMAMFANFVKLKSIGHDGALIYFNLEDIFKVEIGEGTLVDKKSFPSGHSSVSMYNAVFIVIYVGLRIPSKRSFIGLGYLLQSAVLGLAFYVCLSRITDHKHHWSDVLIGGFIGTFLAIVIPYIITKRYYSMWKQEIGTDSRELESQSVPTYTPHGHQVKSPPTSNLSQGKMPGVNRN
ncbi:Phospholipid phosphatase 3 [Cichlidogyrus casuarinus]|uniref:Phospholipid phosphatase 3 n=1 Tax=Cichlidogyrus casuarinus TaxID=1844966 RepID=A0ABD2Q8K0_9PLAT